MLPISVITAQGFKGQNRTYKFVAPVTIFTGPNSRGKSAMIEAMTLALTGQARSGPDDPKPVKDNRMIYDLYGSAPTMQVGVSGAVNIGRQYVLQKDRVSYIGPKETPIDAMIVDPGEYLSQTGPQRTKTLFKLFAGETMTTDVFLSEIASELKAGVSGGPEVEQAARRVAAELDPPRKDEPLVDWVERLLEKAKENKKLAAANKDRLTEAVRADSQLTESMPVQANAEELLSQARTARDSVSKEIQSIDAQLTAVRKSWREAKAARDELARIGDAPDIQALESALGEPVPPPEIKRLKATQRAREELGPKLGALRSELSQAEKTLKAVSSAKVCIYCGQKTGEVNHDNVVRQEAEIQRLQKEVADTEAELAVAATKAEEAETAYETAKMLHQAFVASTNALAEARANLAGHAHLADRASKLPELEAQGQRLGVELEERQRALAVADKAAEEAQAVFNKLIEFRANAAARERLREELELSQVTFAVRSVLVSVLDKKLKECVATAISPLVDTMNDICGAILPAKISFVKGELLLGSHSHKSSSDSERLLIYAAQCIALASKSPIKVAVIGRLESFDYEKRPALIQHLLELIRRGIILQAILVGVQTGPTPDAYDFGTDVQVEVI